MKFKSHGLEARVLEINSNEIFTPFRSATSVGIISCPEVHEQRNPT